MERSGQAPADRAARAVPGAPKLEPLGALGQRRPHIRTDSAAGAEAGAGVWSVYLETHSIRLNLSLPQFPQL